MYGWKHACSKDARCAFEQAAARYGGIECTVGHAGDHVGEVFGKIRHCKYSCGLVKNLLAKG
jgi:hypothetical protein